MVRCVLLFVYGRCSWFVAHLFGLSVCCVCCNVFAEVFVVRCVLLVVFVVCVWLFGVCCLLIVFCC